MNGVVVATAAIPFIVGMGRYYLRVLALVYKWINQLTGWVMITLSSRSSAS